MCFIKQITKTSSLNHQQEREVLELLNELRDGTVKQKQAAVLQRLVINLSRSLLYRLDMNRAKSCNKQAEVDIE